MKLGEGSEDPGEYPACCEATQERKYLRGHVTKLVCSSPEVMASLDEPIMLVRLARPTRRRAAIADSGVFELPITLEPPYAQLRS